jgi:Zn-dependent M16 (insulinase) family peptidase
MTDYQIGSTYHGFILQRMEYISEISSTVYLFEHQLLGTPALAIKNDDPNKTFCIAFQTVPEDSTGVAHILEHSVLMGSRKYPVHDVFGEINKGGLMTFLNAMTGSDTTWYPFATRNITEYFNIMDVYCDVCLNPLLEQTTFEQEGWHYHKESMDAPLQYQGVVLNEMKGAFSDPIRSIFHHTFRGLMPESTYAHESGGDPRNIPDLTYEQFVAFHRRHYHPTNSMLFFYGDADLDRELAAIQDNFFSAYDGPGEKAVIAAGADISEPVFIEDSYGVQPGSELAGKTFFAVGSAVGTVLDRKRNAAFQIIANILYNSDASPLKKAIIEEGLCKDFGGLFIPNSCYKTFMMTYLVGCEADRRDRFLELYNQSLTSMTAAGIDHDLILSELNKYEFSVREELNKAQRGLDLIGKALPALKHGTDPFEALQIENLFSEIRQQALEEGYFEHLIQEYLLENKATVVVTLTPDPEKMARSMQEEQQRLSAYEQSLDQQQLADLVARTGELLQLQHTPNDEQTLALLPRLSRHDLDKSPTFHRVKVDNSSSPLLMINELATNSIMYMEFGLDCSAIDTDLLPWLDLFGTIATEIGTTGRDYMQFAKDINIYTGGFSHSFSTYLNIQDKNRLQSILWFQVKALAGYLRQSVEMVCDVFSDLDLSNRQRIKEIVQREFAWAEHSVQSEGYSIASSRVFSHLSRAGMVNEYVSGATSYLALKDLARNYDALEDQFIDKLGTLRDLLFQRNGLKISVTGSPEDIAQFKPLVKDVSNALGDTSPPAVALDFPALPRAQAFCTSAEVVYNVQGCTLFADQNSYSGHFEVLKTWLSRDYLWNTVRQVGGAYGCFVQFNHISGNFGLVSYRDPQIAKTYAAYDAIFESLQDVNISRSVLDQLIIGTYGSFTPHQGPAARGLTARNEYLSGITPEYKQERIGEIIDTTVDDIRSYAPFFQNLQENKVRATIGNCDKIKEHGALFDDIIDL